MYGRNIFSCVGCYFKEDTILVNMRRARRFKTVKDFVVFTPSSRDVTLAHERACRLGIVPGSPSANMNRLAGCLGEIAVNKYLPRSKYVGDTIRFYDIVYRKQKVEVKSKVCGSSPAPHFSAFVNGAVDMTPEADVFLFTRVRRDFQRVYIVGWLPVSTFLDEAQYIAEGEVDINGYEHRLAGFKIDISELNPPKSFKSTKGC